MFGSGDLGMGISFVLLDEFSGPARQVTQGFAQLEGGMNRLGAKTFQLNQVEQSLGMLEGALSRVVGPGQAVEHGLMELSALTEVSGGALEDIGKKAIALSTTFGGSAAVGVETFKNLLGKLGPEIAQNQAALSEMGSDVFTLSKTMNGDLLGATDALTTAVNIYAGDLTDPMEQTQAMTRYMNAMAKAAQIGSAEVTDIRESIRTGGLAAKSAGVSFEELNALIEIMGKGNVYGSQAGVGLRNIFAIMSQGRFMPKEAANGLKAAGVNIAMLGDTSIPVKERLLELQKVQHDSALVTKVFGMENQNSFRVLMENMGVFDEWTAGITGSTSATDQAAVVMKSFTEWTARARARVESWAIAAFNAGKFALPFVQTTLSLAQGMVSVAPAIVLAQEGLAAWRATSLMTSISNLGLATTFGWLAAAAWAALAPLLPFIAVAAAVAAVVWLGYKAVHSFQDLMAGGVPEEGFWGVIQKIGGVILGVVEAFKTWDGETFSLSENMRSNLERIGVLDLVLRLSTWAVRIKAFFSGVIDAAVEVGGHMKGVFGEIFALVERVTVQFDVWETTLMKLTGSTVSFKDVGKALAYVVGGIVLAFAALAAVVAGAVYLAFKLVLVVGGLFVAWFQNLMTTISDVKGMLEMLVSFLVGDLVNAFEAAVTGAMGFWEFLSGIPDMMQGVGSAIVDAIGAGIRNAWHDLQLLLGGLLHQLPFGEQIGDYFGLAGAGRLSPATSGGGSRSATSLGSTMASMQGQAARPQTRVLNRTTEKVGNYTSNTYLDGHLIHQSVMSAEQANDERGN